MLGSYALSRPNIDLFYTILSTTQKVDKSKNTVHNVFLTKLLKKEDSLQ